MKPNTYTHTIIFKQFQSQNNTHHNIDIHLRVFIFKLPTSPPPPLKLLLAAKKNRLFTKKQQKTTSLKQKQAESRITFLEYAF